MNLLTKIMQFIHRILGTALSILFLVWFLSGLVMIYHTFPRADRADKRAKMDILSPENLPSLDQIEKRLPQNERISHVTLNSYLGQTVFHLRTEKGSRLDGKITRNRLESYPTCGITMEYLFHSEGRFLVHLGPMDSIRSFKRGISDL